MKGGQQTVELSERPSRQPATRTGSRSSSAPLPLRPGENSSIQHVCGYAAQHPTWGFPQPTFLRDQFLTDQSARFLPRHPRAWFSPEKVSWGTPLSTDQSSSSSNWDTTSGLESWCSAQGKERQGLVGSIFRECLPAVARCPHLHSPLLGVWPLAQGIVDNRTHPLHQLLAFLDSCQ